MKTRLLAAAGLLVMVAMVVFYADLLASAFAPNPFPDSTASVERGRQLYERHCAVCHGESGRGDGPAAAAQSQRMDDLAGLAPPPIFPDGVIGYRIANGKDGMPGWKGVVGESGIWDLVNYIRSLRRTGQAR